MCSISIIFVAISAFFTLILFSDTALGRPTHAVSFSEPFMITPPNSRVVLANVNRLTPDIEQSIGTGKTFIWDNYRLHMLNPWRQERDSHWLTSPAILTKKKDDHWSASGLPVYVICTNHRDLFQTLLIDIYDYVADVPDVHAKITELMFKFQVQYNQCIAVRYFDYNMPIPKPLTFRQ
ncbi:hypothetical protein BDF19DRAFT_433331 [Syncephalis fuscata]|nr:hypothetical protein BDF19DRAFT_433331 [Syncephalis fuscata]